MFCQNLCHWKPFWGKNTLLASRNFKLPNQKPLQKFKEEKTIMITCNFRQHGVSTCKMCYILWRDPVTLFSQFFNCWNFSDYENYLFHVHNILFLEYPCEKAWLNITLVLLCNVVKWNISCFIKRVILS